MVLVVRSGGVVWVGGVAPDAAAGHVVELALEEVGLDGSVALVGLPGGGEDLARTGNGVGEQLGAGGWELGLDIGTSGGDPEADSALGDAKLGGDGGGAVALTVEGEGAIAQVGGGGFVCAASGGGWSVSGCESGRVEGKGGSHEAAPFGAGNGRRERIQTKQRRWRITEEGCAGATKVTLRGIGMRAHYVDGQRGIQREGRRSRSERRTITRTAPAPGALVG
jgi:hypothetical protein